jgi:hypothetical protein
VSQETMAQRAAHVDTLLALARLISSAPRPGVSKAWFVLMVGGDDGVRTVVRVDP